MISRAPARPHRSAGAMQTNVVMTSMVGPEITTGQWLCYRKMQDLDTPAPPVHGPEGIWTGNQPSFPDIGGYGNHEYGNRVGVFRILAVLDKHAIKPTLALDKAVADNYPFLVEEGQKRDAEFIAHGLSRRRIIHIGMSEDEERQYIRASIAAVEKATGKRPIGWSGPDFQETPNTPNLLAAAGIRYVCDWGNDEQPYKMTLKERELYSLGVNAYL